MRNLFDFLIGILLEWITWEEKTRPRRGDDPAEAKVKRLNRECVFGFIGALVITAIWGALRFSSPTTSPVPIAEALNVVTALVAGLTGWIAIAAWAFTAVRVVELLSYRPEDDNGNGR